MACHARDPVDVVVGCALVFGALLGAERCGLPSVVLFPNVDLRWAPGRPGFGPGLLPLEGEEGEARDAEIWEAARLAFAAGQPALDPARQELGLPATSHPWEEWDRASLVLLLTSRHFDYPYALPERTLFAGPVLDDPVWSETTSWSSSGGDRPLVLVSLGSSFQDQLDVYRRSIAALGELDVQAIVTLGGMFEPSDFEAAENVEIVATAPHAPILQRAAAMVTHGGHGSVLKALAAGVPVVCLPLGRDQAENGARASWHGAGLVLDREASSAEIEAALTRVLAEPDFAAAAGDLATKIHAEISEGIVVRELERISAVGACEEGSAVRRCWVPSQSTPGEEDAAVDADRLAGDGRRIGARQERGEPPYLRVHTRPGQIALTRIFLGASSSASVPVRWITPALAAAYAGRAGVGRRPAIEYLNRWRLLKAHQLARYTAVSIEQIAGQVGFSSAQILTRAFKNAFGYTPSGLRRAS